MTRTLVIAEPGGTAEGNFGDMIELIHRAKEADADVFKAQWVSDPEQMCERRHITPDHPKRDYYLRAYSWLAFPVEWHLKLRAVCDSLRIAYGCTAFLPQDVLTLCPIVDYLKISSFEANDNELSNAPGMASMLGRIIISTGMTDAQPPSPSPGYVRLLHCVSSYPAPIEDMNLRILGQEWCSGLSDHSRDIDMGGFAVCVGAKIVEAHFRLYSCSPSNPDYATAFDPGEFCHYVAKIRKAERALGDGIKRVQPSEEWALPYKVTA